jgi:hypothetical protein
MIANMPEGIFISYVGKSKSKDGLSNVANAEKDGGYIL